LNFENGKLAKIVSFRIYATNNYYCDPENSNEIKSLELHTIDNFPGNEWRLKYYFGKVPEDIIYAKNRLDGFSLVSLKALTNSLDKNKTGKEQLEDCIVEIQSNSDFFTKYKWYTTLVIEKSINPFEYGIIDPNGEFNSLKFLDYLTKINDKINFSEIFNKVAFCLMDEIDNCLFLKPLVENSLFISLGTDVIGRPNLSMHGEVSKIIQYKSLDQEHLISKIEKIGNSENEWLNFIVYWRIAMLKENDRWKKFIFGFLCLENLTHRLFEIIFEKTKYEKFCEENEEYHNSIITPLLDSDPNIKRLPLATEFSYIVGTINPDRYSDNIEKFEKCRCIRNGLSHGSLTQTVELPFNELNSLLDFYTGEVLKLL